MLIIRKRSSKVLRKAMKTQNFSCKRKIILLWLASPTFLFAADFSKTKWLAFHVCVLPVFAWGSIPLESRGYSDRYGWTRLILRGVYRCWEVWTFFGFFISRQKSNCHFSQCAVGFVWSRTFFWHRHWLWDWTFVWALPRFFTRFLLFGGEAVEGCLFFWVYFSNELVFNQVIRLFIEMTISWGYFLWIFVGLHWVQLHCEITQ